MSGPSFGPIGIPQDHLPSAAEHTLRLAQDSNRALTERLATLETALREAQAWHESENKALSKSGRIDADYHWRRQQHFAQAEAIEDVLRGGTPALPFDVVELVVAARIVAFEDHSPEALKQLDQAAEAFGSRVPWDDEPDENEEGQANG